MSTYKNSGQYVLEQLQLINVKGSGPGAVDLIPFMIEVNLYESFEDKMMSGNISVVDTLDMNEVLPLAGEEQIQMTFYTAGNEQNPIIYTGEVYKVSQEHRITEHATGYTMYFASQGVKSSDRSKVNKGYKTTADSIVADLYNTYLLGSPSKPLEKTSATGLCEYTFGNVTPLEAISVLERFTSGGGNAGFMFWENNQNFNFKPLQELYSQAPVAKYDYGMGGTFEDLDNKEQEAFERIQDFKVYDENSISDRIQDGLHGSRHILFDLVHKEYVDDDTIHYSKEEWFGSSLGKVPVKKPVEKKEDIVFLSYGSGEQDILLHRDRINGMMKKIEFAMFSAELMVFGDSKLKCGDVVECSIPNLNVDQVNIENGFTGNFLISGIKHTLLPTAYTQVLHVQKDSYEEASQ